MSHRYQYTTIDTIISKYLRDFKGLPFDEGDIIEWIGEALGFMQIPNVSEEDVYFAEVKNYQVQLPKGLHYIIQVAKKNDWDGVTSPTEFASTEEEDLSLPEVVNSSFPTDTLGYGSTFGAYSDFIRRGSFSPVLLSDHTFFNTLVCQLEVAKGLYQASTYEYTVVEDTLRFNFKTGIVAIAYLRNKLDKNTGYPLIPDHASAISAITYYLAWKVKEMEGFSHREGAMQLAQLAESKWRKYIKQFKNENKMPQSLDEYENLRKQSSYILPRTKSIYGFFGNYGGYYKR